MNLRMLLPTMRTATERQAQSRRKEEPVRLAGLDDLWMHVVRPGCRRVRIALAESRLLYCDYEGPRAMSDTELSEFGIARGDIAVLAANEAVLVVRRVSSSRLD